MEFPRARNYLVAIGAGVTVLRWLSRRRSRGRRFRFVCEESAELVVHALNLSP